MAGNGIAMMKVGGEVGGRVAQERYEALFRLLRSVQDGFRGSSMRL